MKVYNETARGRIDRVVRAVEANFDDATTKYPKFLATQPWLWWVLIENLDPDTHEAPANPLEWYVKENDGDGEYVQDISVYKVRDTLKNSGAVAGSIVLCRPIGSENGTVWEIVLCPGPTPFMLKTSLTPGGTADAYPTEPDGTILNEAWYITVTDTIGDKRARGKDDVAEGDGPGALGLAEVLGDGTVAIVEIQQQTKRCSAALTADAGPGASVTVDTVVPLDGGQNPVNDSTSATIASCVMPAADRALDNAACIIEWNETADTWKITWVHNQTRSIRGTLGAALVSGTTTNVSITSPVSCDGGQVPSGTVTVYNIFDWDADSGGECWALWNETTDHYELVQVECPA